jgi:hypothetical protein
MMIKVSEATPSQINYLVAKIEGMNVKLEQVYGLWSVMTDNYKFYEPATDWAQGGPIIEREGISLTSYLAEEDPYWIGSVECQYKNFNATAYYEEYGPTPLIAAMRCYVASKLGDTIDIPDELLINP